MLPQERPHAGPSTHMTRPQLDDALDIQICHHAP